eukprot:TRINITY_DN18519_c0_g1_i2.p1 TRINITY_DN18519_c0_g1~~TRINITY_DN18519_c0_g1_i2.p1  ORF type:complete len:979 (+),score=308.39 TRINITY_DN18519_c0_g1_i2:52-2937(+)
MPAKRGKGQPEPEPAAPKPETAKWMSDMELAWQGVQGTESSGGWNALSIAQPPPRPADPPQGVVGPKAMLLHGKWCEYYYALRLHHASVGVCGPAEAELEREARSRVTELAAARGLAPHERALMRQKDERERDRFFPRRLRPVTLRGLRTHYGFDVQSESLWAEKQRSDVLMQSSLPSPGRSHRNKRRRPRRAEAVPDDAPPRAPDTAPLYVAQGSPRSGLPGLTPYNYTKIDLAASVAIPEKVLEGGHEQVGKHLVGPYREVTWRNSIEQRAHHGLRALFMWLSLHVAAKDVPAEGETAASCFQKREGGSAAMAELFAAMASAGFTTDLQLTLPRRAVAALRLRPSWEGVEVTHVPADGVALKAGVRVGMLLSAVGETAVGTVEQARAAIAEAPEREAAFTFVLSSGVRVSVVRGRHPGTVGQQGEPIPGPARSWNVVTWPDQRRSFVDVWGAAGGGMSPSVAQKDRPVGFYWLSPPAEFLSEHFPAPPVSPPPSSRTPGGAPPLQTFVPETAEQRSAQLLRLPVPLSEWEMRPAVTAAFHSHGLSLLSHQRSCRVLSKAPPLVIEFGLHDIGVELQGRLYRGALRAPPESRRLVPPGFVFESRSVSSRKAHFAILPPDPGEYVFEVLCRRPPHPLVVCQQAAGLLPASVRPPPFQAAVSYQVVSSVKVGDDHLVPKQVVPPTVAQLLEPLYSKLEQGQPQAFRVSVTTPLVEGVTVLCRERPRDTGSARSRSAAPSRASSADEDKRKGKKGAPPPAHDEPGQAAPPAEETWPTTSVVLPYDPARGGYEGSIASLKRGVVEIYVRIAGKFFPVCGGISVVRQVPTNERELNGGLPLVVRTDTADERAAVTTALTYVPPPPLPTKLVPQPSQPDKEDLTPRDVPSCMSPAPPVDAARRFFEEGSAKAVGTYWAKRAADAARSVKSPLPPRSLSSLSRPLGMLSKTPGAGRPVSATVGPSPR